MLLCRISCLGHNCLWLNQELRRRAQIYYLLIACLLVHLWSIYIASPHFIRSLINKEAIAVPIPQLYYEVNLLGCLCQKKKKVLWFPSSLVSNYTMTLSGMLSTLQFSHYNMSPKLALERHENWKEFKNHNTCHVHMKHNFIIFYTLPIFYLSLIICSTPQKLDFLYPICRLH